MKRDELRDMVLQAVAEVAPEAEEVELDPREDLRDALDLDSMDFLNIVTALHQRLKVDIPEADYPKIRSLDAMLDYLEVKLGG